MVKSNYEDEIIEILKELGGCVTGFNKLKKMRKTGEFNSNYLRDYLDKLQNDGKITYEKVKHRDRYCIKNFDFDNEFKKFTTDLEKIETKLFRKDLKNEERLVLSSQYMNLAMKKYKSIIIGQLYDKSITKSKTKFQQKENAKKKIWNSMKICLSSLKEEDRIKVLDSLLI